MARWFRLIHFDGKAALNVFEGEDHRKAARETHDKAFHLQQRVKANWSTHFAGSASDAPCEHAVRSAKPPRTAQPAPTAHVPFGPPWAAPADIQHPRRPGTLVAHKTRNQKQGNREDREPSLHFHSEF
jgi:hypothetical protein